MGEHVQGALLRVQSGTRMRLAVGRAVWHAPLTMEDPEKAWKESFCSVSG